MADGWLPEGFENKDITAPGRVAGRVAVRIESRRRRVRILRGGVALTALAVLLGAAPLLWRPAQEPGQEPAQAPQSPIARLTATHPPAWVPEEPQASRPTAPSSHFPTSPPFHLAGTGKADASEVTVAITKDAGKVELAWTGSPRSEYIVYRCTSPKFDRCSLAGVVKGTKWVDSEPSSAMITYYRIEPNAGG